jgi:hypothetical protein
MWRIERRPLRDRRADVKIVDVEPYTTEAAFQLITNISYPMKAMTYCHPT